jgi:hypothetical protein
MPAMVIAMACSLVPRAEAGTRSSGPLRQLRFSPDGRYVLAQNDSEVFLLTTRPFTILFRIPANSATDAQFTPDSQQMIFVSSVTRVSTQIIAYQDSEAHVERWSIAGKGRVGYRDLQMPPCGTEALSPNGRVLACDDFQGTLRLIDVDVAATIFEKTQFVKLIPLYSFLADDSIDIPNGYYLGDRGEAVINYSPDSRFVIVCPSGGEGKQVGFDLVEKRELTMRGRLGLNTNLAFIGPERLLIPRSGIPRKGIKTALVLAFPSGKVLSKPRIPGGPIFPAADAGFVLIRPFGKNADPDGPVTRVAAVELSTGAVIISNMPLLDIFGRYYVAGPSNGAIHLYERGKGLQATLVLFSSDSVLAE